MESHCYRSYLYQLGFTVRVKYFLEMGMKVGSRVLIGLCQKCLLLDLKMDGACLYYLLLS